MPPQSPETPRHQDTRTPRHQDTEKPRHQDTETPRHQDTKTPRHQDTITIEACIASVAAAIAAEQGGADRLELNAALELDGLTPSPGLFREVKAACSLPVIVMIRPRPYGFVYTEAEYAAMLRDIDLFMDAGADGIATGFLTANLEIDTERTSAVADRLGGKPFVFHRAFDVTPALPAALEDLIDCGVHRVLTSGGQPAAPEGIPQLHALVEQAADRIEILPGAGIKPGNAAHLIEQTGCTQLHGTFRAPGATKKVEGMDVLRAEPPSGTDAGVVKEIRRVLGRIDK